MAYSEKRGKDRHGRMRHRGRYKLPDGSWGSVSHDDLGQPFYTAKSAEQYADGLETDVRRRVFINPRDGRTTVAQWAVAWFESIEVDDLSTRDYRSRLNAVIIPYWEHVPVGDITEVSYRAWEKKLRAEGYADNSISGIRSLFRTLMEDAVKAKLRPDNPVPTQRAARRGKFRSRRGNEEKVFATPRQALYVARNGLELRGISMYALVLTSFYTGLRIGELTGLTRDRLLLHDDGTGYRILADRQLQYRDGRPTLVGAKYDSGRGLIIHRGLAEVLTLLLASHDKEHVFCAPRGGRMLPGDPTFYSDTWAPMVGGRAPRGVVRGAKARPGIRPVLGVEGMTPHGLRHGHKVLLDEQGHPRVAVEERMGHVLQGVEGTYSHTTLTMELAIAEALQEAWEESLRPALTVRGYGPLPVPDASGELISQKSPRRRRKAPKTSSASPWV